MDKILRLSMIVFCSVVILSCSNGELDEGTENEQATFQATILENNCSYLAVKHQKNSHENSSADLIHVSVSDATLLDENKDETTIEMFEQEMQISISYNGMIAESYPAQIH